MIPPLRPLSAHVRRHNGFTYVEMVLAVAMSAVLMAGLMGVINTAFETSDDVRQRNELSREARFAMQQMVHMVAHTRHLLLPLNDNPNTNWPEHIREQTIPPSAPIGNSTFATAVLALTLPAYIDRDGNGIADADNDADGRIDEDHGEDSNNDGKPGMSGIDDDGDGSVDESDASINPERDDDEEGGNDEDFPNGIDDDGDGNDGEDGTADMNKDIESGLRGVDDDGDGTIDEGQVNDDDEDGNIDEDWLDTVVYYLDADTLKQRTPVPWDEDNSGIIDGRDTIVSDIASNVTRFRVERIETASGDQMVDLTLELTHPQSAENISLQTRVRVGGAL